MAASAERSGVGYVIRRQGISRCPIRVTAQSRAVVPVPRSQQTRCMHGCVLCGTWEVQAVGKGRPPAEKGVRHDAAGQAVWNSDEVIVVKKRANKVSGLAAEPVERRASAERSHGKPRHGGDAEPRGIGRWRLAAHGKPGAGCNHGASTGLEGSGRAGIANQASFLCSTRCRSRMR